MIIYKKPLKLLNSPKSQIVPLVYIQFRKLIVLVL